MRKPLILFVLISLIALSQFIVSVPLPTTKDSLRAQLNPNYLRAMSAYKRLESKLTRNEIRAITAIGILNGARQVEKEMASHLIDVIKDLVENTDVNDEKIVLPKIERIEKQVTRDQQALEVLASAMDLAMGKFSEKDFRNEMKEMLQEVRRKSEDPLALAETVDQKNNGTERVGERIAELRMHILTQMDMMKEMVGERIEKTLKHIIDQAGTNGLIAQAIRKMQRNKRSVQRTNEVEIPAEVRIINSILNEEDFRTNLIEEGPFEKPKDNSNAFQNEFAIESSTKKNIENRSDSKASKRGRIMNNIEDIIKAIVGNITTNRTEERIVANISTNGTTNETGKPLKQVVDPSIDIDVPAKQEGEFPDAPQDEFDDEFGGGGGGGGGLVGIITGLSGGEGGSDVGALIGALTGLISTLFGPGGLDVDSLIGTGTSLIAGLLGGNKNFGTVLGMYVGTAFDGLSGGGGAINNGQFIGNFLGTVVASLSADPEEEDGPAQPLIFVENLISSFLEAKNRKASGEESEDMPQKHDMKNGGSDSGAFVKSFVSHLVSTAISFVLNASLGAVGGASKASSSLAASSSHKPH